MSSSCKLNLLGAMALILSHLSSGHGAFAEPPAGFEVIEFGISNKLPGWPNINDCGQVVFSQGYYGGPESEIFLYDNGIVFQMTNNDVPDNLPDISSNGVISWTHNYDLIDLCFDN